MKKLRSLSGLLKLIIVALVFAITITPTFQSQAAQKAIALNKKSTLLELGKTLQLTASNAAGVKWSSDNRTIATVKNGFVTAKSVGTANIKASSGSTSVTCKISVYKPADTVVLSSENSYIEVGDVFRVKAMITPEDATYRTLSWSVDNTDDWYPAIERVSKNKFKAVEEGTATIVAYQKETKKKYKLKVKVHKVLGTFHIEVNQKKVKSVSTFVGGHLLVEGALEDSDSYWGDNELQFTYSVKDTDIATVDSRGQVNALKEGNTSVIVTAPNGKSVSCKLIVIKKDTLAFDTFYADKILSKVGGGNYGNFENWSGADNTYLYQLGNNQIGVVIHKANENSQSLHIYYYDQIFTCFSNKSINIPYTEWGGMYQGEDGYYYVAVGQKNTEQDNSKTVYSIVKFNADFIEVARCNITGAECSTRIPYDCGNARMTMYGNTLIVHTDRERYTSEDGRNHQSNITFIIDSTTMKQSYVGELFPYNHVSHSFNQFVKMDGSNLIYVDHGDAYPRSVVMQTHYNFSAAGWSDEYRSRPHTSELNLIDIVGAIGDNYTGTKVNGFEIGRNHNIVAGVSIPHDSITKEQLETYDVQNVYVSLVAKDGTASKLKWLTDYKSGGGLSAKNLRMIKISDNEFALVYQICKNNNPVRVGLLMIDSDGNMIKQKEYEAFFSCYTQPIYYDNSIVWIDSNSYANTDEWYADDEENKEQCQFTRISLD